VAITIKETAKTQWRSICTDCTGGIDSLVELLQGRFSKGVMERLCRQGSGLFPRPADIHFSCSCPDHASMCKHVAAVLYGVGARLDQQPALLFRLRAVNEADLVAHVDAALPMSKQGPAAGRMLNTDDVSALFGLDMAAAGVSDDPAAAQSSRGKDRVPKETTSGAKATPRRAVQKQAGAVGKTAAKPAPTPIASASAPATIKPTVAKKKSSVAEVAPSIAVGTKRSVTAKGISGLAAQAKGAGPLVEADGKRQRAIDTGDKVAAPPRAKGSGGATARASGVPAKTRGRPPASKQPVPTKKAAAAIREPKQKPVKWW
jgi:uncharacterized Zn finger protein